MHRLGEWEAIGIAKSKCCKLIQRKKEYELKSIHCGKIHISLIASISRHNQRQPMGAKGR
jgi:hypothetical protein